MSSSYLSSLHVELEVFLFILRALKFSSLSTSPLIDTVKGKNAGLLNAGLMQRASDLPSLWASTE